MGYNDKLNMKWTIEQRKRLSKKMKIIATGRKFSDEAKKKMSLAKFGKPSPRKGSKHSKEAKLKNKLAHLGKPSPMKGKHHTQEAKEKNRQSHIKQRNKFVEWGAKGCLKFQANKEPTTIEKIVYKFLESKNIEFEKQFLIKNKFTADAYIPKLNLIVECDGSYWHRSKEAKNRDRVRDNYLAKYGYITLRLKEEEIMNNTFINKFTIN